MQAEPADTPIQMVVDMRLVEAADRVGEGQGGGQLEDCLKETDYCLLFRVRFRGYGRPSRSGVSCYRKMRLAMSCTGRDVRRCQQTPRLASDG